MLGLLRIAWWTSTWNELTFWLSAYAILLYNALIVCFFPVCCLGKDMEFSCWFHVFWCWASLRYILVQNLFIFNAARVKCLAALKGLLHHWADYSFWLTGFIWHILCIGRRKPSKVTFSKKHANKKWNDAFSSKTSRNTTWQNWYSSKTFSNVKQKKEF